MSFNQQVSDYIYYYPKILGSTACDNIVAHYDKDTFSKYLSSLEE